jgi:tetratricopeptide (TPR) repeat protein
MMLGRVLKNLFGSKSADRVAPKAPDLLQQALNAQAQGRLTDAQALCRQALVLQPENVDLLHLLGVVQLGAGHPLEAIDTLQAVCQLRHLEPEAFFHLAGAFTAAGRTAEAIEAFRHSASLRPGFSPALTALGNLYREMGCLDQAIRCYREALDGQVGASQTWHNLGSVYYECGRYEHAIEAFDHALALPGSGDESRFSRGLALLAAGKLIGGWEAYESRKAIARHAAYHRPYPQPVWSGESLRERTLLVWGEQGVGDEILFASMYPELIASAGHCVFECTPKLATLFRRSFSSAEVFARPDAAALLARDDVDFQLSAASLARLCRADIGSFPRHSGYLLADRDRIGYWRSRLARMGGGLRVGICWRSANRSVARELANSPLVAWAELFKVPGVELVSLQYDDCRAELDAVREQLSVTVHRFADVDYFDDLDEVAALTGALDLVISARTTVSWLSAALGVPTWQFSGGGDWRGLGTSAVPWMPGITRFQRTWDEPWERVISRIVRRLRDSMTALP